MYIHTHTPARTCERAHPIRTSLYIARQQQRCRRRHHRRLGVFVIVVAHCVRYTISPSHINRKLYSCFYDVSYIEYYYYMYIVLCLRVQFATGECLCMCVEFSGEIARALCDRIATRKRISEKENANVVCSMYKTHVHLGWHIWHCCCVWCKGYAFKCNAHDRKTHTTHTRRR